MPRRPTSPRAMLLGLVLLVAAAAILPAQARAQDRGSFSVLGGITHLDLSGVATAPIVSFRGTSSLDRTLVVEGALGYLAYGSQADLTVHHLLPEFQVQVQRRGSRARPYVGIGVGLSHERWPEANFTELTTSAAVGIRVPMGADWSLQGEFRLRAIDPWTGSTADFGVGVAGHF
jgi:outer membrane protein W